MAVEIERKFLVAGDAWREVATSSKRIRQGYLCTGGGASVRIRLIDEDEARLTVKSRRMPGPGLAREEFEYAVPYADGLALMALCPGTPIDKVRHLVPAGGGAMWEVDVFAAAHAGLVLAEIELQAMDQAVTLPPWIGREVTDDPRYGNEALAQDGPPAA